ncbi:MAG: hypothetical protein V3W34_14195 [Phycisphaerae bacterium]
MTATSCPSLRPPAFLTVCVLILTALNGCGYSGGEALFMFGLFQRPKIKAEFKLTAGPVVVLVDDLREHCYWPEATTILAEQLAEQLKEHNAAKLLIPHAALQRLRQSYPNFDELSYRRIAQLLHAEQAIAVEVRSFFATVDPTDATAAASMSAAIKVIDAREETQQSKARLWPRSPGGRIFQAEISADRVARAKTRKGILEVLTGALAEKMAKSFYDRKMDDFEKQ